MSGYAFVINGIIDEALLEPTTEKQTLLNKLLKKQVIIWPKITELQNGDKFIEIHAKQLESQLIIKFKDYLQTTIKTSWEVTQNMIEGYLSLCVEDIFIRGTQKKENIKPEGYIEVGFSGCAGVAETSARLASHWFEIWYKKHKLLIDEQYLIPYGFTPNNNIEKCNEQDLFFPLGEITYALYTNDIDSMYLGDSDIEVKCNFDIDQSIIECGTINNKESIEIFNAKLNKIMQNPRCYCQLCTPELDLSLFQFNRG